MKREMYKIQCQSFHHTSEIDLLNLDLMNIEKIYSIALEIVVNSISSKMLHSVTFIAILKAYLHFVLEIVWYNNFPQQKFAQHTCATATFTLTKLCILVIIIILVIAHAFRQYK